MRIGMIGKVTVRQEMIPGTAAEPGVYDHLAHMDFEVRADVPSELRKAARETFTKQNKKRYRILSITSMSRSTVQILVTDKPVKPVVPPGWMHKKPPATKPRG